LDDDNEPEIGNCSRQIISNRWLETSADVVQERQGADRRAQGSCRDERVSVDVLVLTEQRALPEPVLELLGTADVVSGPVGDLRVDEVLYEIERRRGWRSAPWLKPLRTHTATVPPAASRINTV